MPTIRPDVRQISPYEPGRPIAEVAAELGFDPETVAKLASNESPLPPFPAVQEAMAAAAAEVNRYPDNDCRLLRSALGDHLQVPSDHIWVGGGSSELLRVIALATGGPRTSAVYGWPSFVIYRLASMLAATERIEVPLDTDHRYDLDAMTAAIRPDTTVVYLCNPNNPTGTLNPADRVAGFVERVPSDVLVVIDEAYHEYVTDEDYATALPLALDRPNVVVTRTFSKIYALAALRVGYAVSRPENLVELRKAQAPFTVGTVGQAAALEALRHQDEVDKRAADNAAGRRAIEDGLAELGVEHVASQANFVYLRLDASTAETTDAFLRHGVMVRPMSGGWVRTTVGLEDENRRFLQALADELPQLGTGGAGHGSVP